MTSLIAAQHLRRPRAGRHNRGGNVMIEFAVSIFLILAIFGGTFQFGYAFYVYNLLCNQIRAGARYAAIRDFKCSNTTGITSYKDAVKKMVAYGKPNPSVGDGIVVPGLTLAAVNVEIKASTDGNGDGTNDDADNFHTPSFVQVSTTGFSLNALFASYSLTGKPSLIMPYVGRYAPEETE
ncbi:MAG: TadE/TadG family type IV pilus assembly protein [Bryobacteraceae bacterium]